MRITFKVAIISAMVLAWLCTGTLYAADSGWSQEGAPAPTNLSGTGDIRQPAVTLNSQDQPIVVWSNVGFQAANGIYMARPGNAAQALVATGTQHAWAPDAVYYNDQLSAVWVQGTFPYPGSIMHQHGAESPQTVFGPTYGYTTPRLLVGQDRWHMFFASAPTADDFSKADLYYTSRRFTDATWIAPTVIITRSQANPPHGGIWYPHVALSNDKTVAHLVWEQTAGTLSVIGVWYTRGVWDSTQQRFAWGPLTRISPNTQNGVRPKVAVDGANRVHVTWVEQQFFQGATLQYINYRRFENGQWFPPLTQSGQRLDPDPVQVNTYRPTWSTISLDARGNTLCVAWHGYRAAPGATGSEEIIMRCSTNGGQSWLPRTLNASETPERLSLFPALKIDSRNTLHLAWEEHQGGLVYTTNYDTFYRQGPLPRERIYLPLVMRTA